MRAIARITLRAAAFFTIFFVMIMMGVAWEVSHPSPTSSTSFSSELASLDFVFGLTFVSVAVVYTISKLLSRYPALTDARIALPDHWRLSLLDVIHWMRAHWYADLIAVFGFFLAFIGLGVPVTNAVTVLNLPLWANVGILAVILFVSSFIMVAAEAIYTSAVVPNTELAVDDVERIVESRVGETLTKAGVEYLKKQTFTRLPPNARKAVKILSAFAMASVAGAWFSAHIANLTMMVAFAMAGAIAMMSTMTIEMLASRFGTKTPLLAKILSEGEPAEDAP